MLNRVPFVRWDRFTESPGEVIVYGWIDREDGHSDFVLVTFGQLDKVAEGLIGFGFTTSSHEHSTRLHRLLYATDESDHIACQRVEHELPNVHNSVHIVDNFTAADEGHLPGCDTRGSTWFCARECPHYDGWQDREL